MNTLFKFLLLAGIFLLALACGGGGGSTYEDSSNRTESGVRTILLEGTIDDSTLGKTRWASKGASKHTGKIFDLNNPNQQWEMVIDDAENFSAEIVRRSDIAIEIYRNGSLVLSRVMHGQETQNNTRAKVNTITHLQASIVRTLLKTQVEKDLKSTIETTNATLFGRKILSDLDYKVNNLFSHLPDLSEEQLFLKAMMATYGQLFRSSASTALTSLQNKLNQALSNTSYDEVARAWLRQIRSLSNPQEARVYASAHEGAKNSGLSRAALVFGPLENTIKTISPLLTGAIDEAKVAPVFGHQVDTVRKATVGALFQYTYPKATTEDVLGIVAYRGSWISAPPKGIWKNSADEGRTLQFLPDSDDIGKTFNYGLRVEGGNGRVTTAQDIYIQVNAPVLTPRPRKPLPNRPVVGPVVDREYLYLVSSSASGHEFYLQKFSQSDIQVDNDEDITIPHSSWTLPTSTNDVTDLKLHMNTLYVSTGKAILGFDASFRGSLSRLTPPTYSNNFVKSVKHVLLDKKIIHYERSGNVQSTTLSLSDNTLLSKPTSFFMTMGNSFTLSGNTALYGYNQSLLFAAGNQEHLAYFFNASGNLEIFNSFIPKALEPTPSSFPISGLPLNFVQSSDNTLHQWWVGDKGLVPLKPSGNHVVNIDYPHAVTGNLLLYFTTTTSSDNLGSADNTTGGNFTSGSNSTSSSNTTTSTNTSSSGNLTSGSNSTSSSNTTTSTNTSSSGNLTFGATTTSAANLSSANLHILNYTLQGNSLSSTPYFFSESSVVPLKKLYFENNPKTLIMNVTSPGSGVDASKSGSWIYTVGNDGVGSDNWFIQAHLLEPAD